MKNIIIFGVFSIVLQTAILSQDKQNLSSKDSLSNKSIDFSCLSNNFSDHHLQNSDSSLIQNNYQIFQIDSLKYLYELLLVHNLIKRDFEGFSNSQKILEHRNSVDFILLTIKQYYMNQPNYDLGEVGEYLGVSKKMIALMLGIISL